jgi:signal peptidase I
VTGVTGMTVTTGVGIATAAAGAASLVLLSFRRRYLLVTVAGVSMAPTLRSGDRVLVRRTGLRRIRTGDIIVLGPSTGSKGASTPDRGPAWIIKRATALPGDPIPHDAIPAMSDAVETEVPPGKLLLLGDNPENSTDSRQAGYFDGRRLVGRVVRQVSAARTERSP